MRISAVSEARPTIYGVTLRIEMTADEQMLLTAHMQKACLTTTNGCDHKPGSMGSIQLIDLIHQIGVALRGAQEFR